MPEDFDQLFEQAGALFHGSGAEENKEKAIELFRIGASNGHAASIAALAVLYEHGLVVEENHPKAAHYYRSAAEKGNEHAQFNLGRMLYISGDYDEALNWLSRGMEREHSSSIVYLARAYEYGNGVEQNYEKARKLYEKAAALEDTDAQLQLAYWYRDGRGVNKDISKAIEMLEFAKRNNDPRAWYEHACLYQSGIIATQDPMNHALECHLKAAELGYVDSLEWCGEVFAFGREFEIDLSRGIDFLEKAIDEGSVRAKYLKAVLLARGHGYDKDKQKALRLCKEAADAGEESAKRMYEVLIEEGVIE